MYEIIQFLSQLNSSENLIEFIAVLFSIIYVILAAKQNIWCWSASFISVLIYIYICYNAQLYPETGLQIFYLFMAGYGYYSWGKSDYKLKVKQWNVSKHLFIILIGSIFTFLMGFYFATYTAAKMPIIDSFTTVFAIIATYMVTKKILENWLYWIVIDAVSVHLYLNRELHLTSLLFMLYTIIAIYGYLSWVKKIKEDV